MICFACKWNQCSLNSCTSVYLCTCILLHALLTLNCQLSRAKACKVQYGTVNGQKLLHFCILPRDLHHTIKNILHVLN